jgi:hypothetical protein
VAEFEPALASVLDEVLPRIGDVGDWEGVLRDAERAVPSARSLGPRWRTRRVIIVAVAAALAALIPLVAVAANQGWWFFSFVGAPAPPAPTSGVVVVERGSWHGTPWALAAYRTRRQGICIGFTANPPAGPPPSPTASSKPSGSFGCADPVRGMPGLPTGTKLHELAFSATENLGATVIAGPTAADVSRVELVHADGSTTDVSTVAAPPALHAPIRFFVAVLSPATRLQSIRALSKGGRNLETAALKTVPAQTGPNGITYHMQWGS